MQYNTLKITGLGRECTMDVDLGSRAGTLMSVPA